MAVLPAGTGGRADLRLLATLHCMAVPTAAPSPGLTKGFGPDRGPLPELPGEWVLEEQADLLAP